MPGYVITSVFDVSGGKLPLGQDVLARPWGAGHRFSYCDGGTLTLVVEVTAIDVAAAFESVLSRAELVWRSLGQSPLGPPVTLRVQGAVEESPVPAGLPGTDDGPPVKRARRAAVRRLMSGRPPVELVPEVAIWFDEDDPPDGGGLAGVREPRRPRPGPPGLRAAQDLPAAPDLAG